MPIWNGAVSSWAEVRELYRRFMCPLMEEHGAYTTMSAIRALPEDAQRELLDRRGSWTGIRVC